MLIPIMLAIVALVTAFLLLFILAGLTDINTVTPILVSMIGLGVGIDYSLFIVTRFRQLLHEGLSPRDAAAEAGASAGRAVLFAGLTVAISVSGPGLLRPRLRDQARHRQRPRRADHGADRELAAAGGAVAARPQDRPAEGAVPAADRRFGGGPREDARSPAGAGSSPRNARIVFPRRPAGRMLALAATSALVRLGAADQGTQPKEQTSRRAYDLLAEGFGARLQRADPDRRRRERRHARAAEDLRPGAGAPGRASVRQAAVQRREDRRDRLRDADAPRRRTRRPTSSSTGCGATSSRRRRRRRRRRLRLGPDGRLQGHRRPDHRAGCRCSCSTSSASR